MLLGVSTFKRKHTFLDFHFTIALIGRFFFIIQYLKNLVCNCLQRIIFIRLKYRMNEYMFNYNEYLFQITIPFLTILYHFTYLSMQRE